MSDIIDSMDMLSPKDVAEAYREAHENIRKAICGLLELDQETACFVLSGADLDGDAGVVKSGFFMYAAPVVLVDPMIQSILESLSGYIGREDIEKVVRGWVESDSDDIGIEAEMKCEQEDLEPFM